VYSTNTIFFDDKNLMLSNKAC